MKNLEQKNQEPESERLMIFLQNLQSLLADFERTPSESPAKVARSATFGTGYLFTHLCKNVL